MIKKNLTLILLVVLFIYNNKTFAQLDNTFGGNNQGSTSLGTIDAKAREVQKPKSLNFGDDNGFKTAANQLKKKQQKQQAEENLKYKGILTQAKIAEENYLKNFKQINGQLSLPVIDQDLGSIRTDSKAIHIKCRDFGFPDGDRVTIYVNDEPVVINLTLKRNFQSFALPLEVGINKVKIVALNQGSSGPNTAAFKLYNDTGNLISSKEWNLATGAKATMIVAKNK